MAGGHGHDEHHGPKTNENNIRENDADLPYKIRPIDLIKYNPNLFHVWIYDPVQVCNLLGGVKTDITMAIGGAIGWLYYSAATRNIPDTYYIRHMRLFSRVALGAFAGLVVGYLKFGDR